MNETLGEYFRILRDRWRWVVLVMLIIIGGTAALLLVQPKQYESVSSVFVSTPRDDADTYYQGHQFARERSPSYVALLQSEQLARRVIGDLGLDMEPAELIASTKAAAIPSTVLIQLTTKAKSPGLARQINQTYIDELEAEVASIETIPGALTPRAELIVVEPPTLPAKPGGFPPILLLAAATGAGLAAGAGLAVVLALLDTKIRRPEDAEEAAGAPVLAVLAPDADPVEPYRQLRGNLTTTVTEGSDADSHVVLICSTEPGAGKTWLALELARVFRDEGSRPAVIDLDVRNSLVASLTRSLNPVTVADVVIDRTSPSDTESNRRDGMTIVPVGDVGAHGGRMIDSPRVGLLLDRVKLTSNWLLIDTAAAAKYSDALRLARHADFVLVVAQAGRTRFDRLSRLAGEFREAGHPIGGIVFNDLPPAKRATARAARHARVKETTAK
ncbi:polysaccharide biosynthesis tyrosine autokinase [Antrihabitans stalactiti]|nr:polysaccharide biosynthesis tyrosine autokinase [Antrihabitans stalactiti]